MPGDSRDLSNLSLTELFRIEVENQSALAIEALLALEKDPAASQWLDVVMRAGHSLKGASRIAGRSAGVRIAHAMEDCVVTVQRERSNLTAGKVDALLRGLDLFAVIAKLEDDQVDSWETSHRLDLDAFMASLSSADEPEVPAEVPTEVPSETPPPVSVDRAATTQAEPRGEADRTVRVRAANLNRLLGFAGEGLVRSKWLETFSGELLDLKRKQERLTNVVAQLHEDFMQNTDAALTAGLVAELREVERETRETLAERLEAFQRFERDATNVSNRLYEEVLESRMRPFGDRSDGFPRMVRDIARTVGKEVNFEVVGESTAVDRDILEKLDAPLGHLLRNAIDHGLETPEERRATGKPPAGLLRVGARHSAGTLLITVADDGKGVDTEAIRDAVVTRGMVSAEAASRLSDPELLEFLFLPSFTLKKSVTEISGRGVGLDVVKTMLKEVGGSIRMTTGRGSGTEFHLQLPLTLSVLRVILVNIGGEPYAFPLSRVTSALRVTRSDVASVQGRQHIPYRHQQIGLVAAHQALGLEPVAEEEELSVLVIGDGERRFGLVVDRFLSESELVVRTLDPHFGKVQDISAAAMMEDGSPALIIDVDDILNTIENLISGGRLLQVGGTSTASGPERKRILVVDDSLTVRELERKLLERSGYEVEVAVDGMDGWNAARTGRYDLIVTDVDMPRLDGIELVTRLKADARLNAIPVMIVSYKDREEDRRRGLDAGADYYLSKGSFQDESLIHAVADLIGEAHS